MKKQFLRAVWRFTIPAVFAFSMQIIGPLAVQRDPAVRERIPRIKELSRLTLPGSNDLQLIVELSSPSVVRYLQPSAKAVTVQPRVNLQSQQANTYRAQLSRERQQVTGRLSAITGVQVQSYVDTVMNAVIARVPVDKYREVRNLPGVKKVYFSRLKRMTLDAAAGVVNAPGLWNAVSGGRASAGKGVKIGIIDSGIDITNQMFTDSSLTAPTGFPKADTTADLAFTNSKVIVARNYVSLVFNYNPQRVQSAIDEVGHGTFVAAVAAGKQFTAPAATISGMAPGAYLGSYKVFGTPGVNDGATDAGIIAAINDAVNDGMDVINLSLGGLDYVPPSEDPEVTAIENAISHGVIVTISAGNDGPNTHTIGSPGTAPDAITVGAVSNSRMLAAALHVTAPSPVPSNLGTLAYQPGLGPTTTVSGNIVDVTTLDGNGFGCSAFPVGSLSGKIAFIERGGVPTRCLFTTKIGNAASAGSKAVVVYNDNPTEGAISMSVGGTSIPSVMVSNPDGLLLKAFIAAHSDATVSIDSASSLAAVPTTAGVVSSFTSIGPDMDFSIKPDLVAVGQDVYSAALNSASSPNAEISSSTGFTSADGTSFSSPMVAGAAAAVKQLFPNLSPLAIKSILMSTASQNATTDGSNSPQVLQVGSGLLNMGAAAAAQATFAPAALNFGTQSYSGTVSLTRTLLVTNISSQSDSFAVSANPIISGPAITFSKTNTGPIPPGSSVSVDVTLQATAPQSRGFQGFITLQSANTSTIYRIPYWAGLYVLDSSRVLSVAQSGASFSSLGDAMKAARPGNVIEIQDSGTYTIDSAGLTIDTNGEGLPLHGITIRAVAGMTPVLDGTGNDPSTSIHIIGLQNVALQGLTVRGGGTGVQVSQTSSDTPVSATIDHCTISNSSDSNSAGILMDAGGTLHVTKSTITNAAGVGIVATDGTYLSVLGSIVQNNSNDGIDAFNSNVEILNSTVSGNNGSGAYLQGSTGTVDGSTFSQNHGQFGDGIEVADGNLTITNNTFESNDQSGVWLFEASSSSPGPVVNVARNTFHGNPWAGIDGNPSQSMFIDSNFIKDNGRGIRASLSTKGVIVNNIIVRSTDTSFGHGIQVTDTSNVSIINNTIYKNALNGINQGSGTTVSVVNTIVAGNTKSDVAGVAPGNVQFSLIGDGGITGNGNTSGDPRFLNPTSDDFHLAAGSPALDTGSNAAAGLPFLDFSGRFRVAAPSSSSALPGSGTVDMGAIEGNSTYPLVFPLLANGTQSVLGDTFTTGYAMLNNASSGAATTFAAYDSTGLLPGNDPTNRNIAAGSQFATLGYQLFGMDAATPALGSVLASSAQPLAGFFLLFDSNFSRFSVGANASDGADLNLLFLKHESDASGNSRYVVFNPGVNNANVTVTPISTGGAPLAVAKTATVAPKSQSVFNFDGVTTSSGYVKVQSDRPVSGLEVIDSSQAMTALGAVTAGSEARLFFPHIAVNGGYTTQIGIVNTSANPAGITLTAYDSNGQVLGTPAAVSLAANGQLLQSVDSLFAIGAGPLVTGYVVAQSDQPIQGFTSFRYDVGTTHSAAVVPAGSVPEQLLLFSHVAHNPPTGLNYQTGIALLNPFGVPVGYTLRVFDASGVKVKELSDTLAPGQKVAKYLSHPLATAGFFTDPISLGDGHVEVQTDYGLLGFELFFTENLSQLASVPAQILK